MVVVRRRRSLVDVHGGGGGARPRVRIGARRRVGRLGLRRRRCEWRAAVRVRALQTGGGGGAAAARASRVAVPLRAASAPLLARAGARRHAAGRSPVSARRSPICIMLNAAQ